MARKSKKKFDPNEPIVGEVVDLRTDVEKELENQPVAPDGPQEPESKSLSRDELYKLQVAQLQVRAAEAELNLQMYQRDVYLKQIDPENKLKTMAGYIRSRSDEAATGKQSYAQIVKEIEARLGINLKEWAYNDENGLLSRVDQ